MWQNLVYVDFAFDADAVLEFLDPYNYMRISTQHVIILAQYPLGTEIC